MRVLVTGITGRIGANLAAALIDEGHQVSGLVWPEDRRVEKLRVELQYGSETDTRDVQKAVDGMEAVYHLGAAYQGGGPFTTQEYFVQASHVVVCCALHKTMLYCATHTKSSR